MTRTANRPMPVKFFRQDRGNEPVRDWLRAKLSAAERKIIGEDIKTMQWGWPLGMPLVRAMGDGLFEVRSTLPTRIARVLFSVHEGHIVLLHGFLKTSKETPETDLKVARKRKVKIDES